MLTSEVSVLPHPPPSDANGVSTCSFKLTLCTIPQRTAAEHLQSFLLCDGYAQEGAVRHHSASAHYSAAFTDELSLT